MAITDVFLRKEVVLIGTTVSHYKILEKLGGGGMGVIYKAEDTKLKRNVVLKFLSPDITRDPDAKERFMHEAQAASALDHANICTIYEFGKTEEDQLFIAMAYYEGETLKKRIENAALPVHEVIDYAFQIAQALVKAHEHGIIHRDIKPANIMVTKEGVVKLLDFGLAKLMGHTILTKSGNTSGTAAYMSPEQSRGELVDLRTDIWSLGIVLYEMLTGVRPFKGEYENALIYSILNTDYESIDTKRADVPAQLQIIVGKCLQKDPSKRYQDVTELLADLKRCQLGPTPQRHPKRRLGVLLVASLVALAVVLYFLVRQKDAEQRPKGSIAVLPFKNLSDNKDDEYFSEGIVDDIIAQLSKTNGVRVVPQTATVRFRNSERSPKDIGRELNVASVLIGSIRRAGDKVRIIAQLVDAEQESSLWTETYDRESKETLVMQSDIARDIVGGVHTVLIQPKSDEAPKTARGPIPASKGSSVSGEPRGRPERWALVVGISEYGSKEIPRLQFAARDAESLGAFLEKPGGGGYDKAHLRILKDHDATLSNLKDALTVFLSNTIDIDQVMIFFAGQSAADPNRPQNPYILPYDADPSSLGSTALPLWELANILSRSIVAKRVILMTDLCHDQKNEVNQYLLDIARVHEGIVVFTASGVKEASQETPTRGLDLFTSALIEGMEGKADFNADHIVTFKELAAYVQDQVKRVTKGAQDPTSSNRSYDADMTMTVVTK